MKKPTKDRWIRSRHTVYNCAYHLIWCSKYRRKLLDTVEDRLKELLVQKAQEIYCTIETMEVMPDHVHLFVKCPPTLAPHFVVKQMKGFTSRILREEFPHIKSRLPNLWTHSYYCESVGHISQDVVTKYIEDQKKI